MEIGATGTIFLLVVGGLIDRFIIPRIVREVKNRWGG